MIEIFHSDHSTKYLTKNNELSLYYRYRRQYSRPFIIKNNNNNTIIFLYHYQVPLNHVRELTLSLNIYTFSIISCLPCCRDVSQIFIGRFSEAQQVVKNISLVPWIVCCINILQVTTFISSATSYSDTKGSLRST